MKSVQVLGATVFLLLAILLTAFVFMAAALPPDSALPSGGDHPGLLPWALMTVFCLALVESALHLLRAYLALDEDNLRLGERARPSRGAALYRRLAVLAGVSGAMVLMVGAAAFAGILVAVLSSGRLRLSAPVMVMAGMTLVYGALRPMVVRGLGRLSRVVGQASRGALPNYVLENDGIRLDLKLQNLGSREKREVWIGFEELEEVRVLTWREADTARRYGLDPGVAGRHVSDLYRYLKGEMERPRTYVAQLSSGGVALFLRGPEVLYLLTVGREDASDLLEAFEKHRAR